jgi:amidase
MSEIENQGNTISKVDASNQTVGQDHDSKSGQDSTSLPFNRRAFFGIASGAAAAVTTARSARADNDDRSGYDVQEATIVKLQADMASGRVTAAGLVRAYLRRIRDLDQGGPSVNSVLQINPDSLAIAASLDQERKSGIVRGPLHGIPIFVKGNIDTADKMLTTAGSLALVGPAPALDATVAARLRAAGAVILGKTNLSEWANFRSTRSTSGWSGLGGQTNNPYALDRNPGGSSSGSGAGVSANFVAASLGTETDGSIVNPANNDGVVGIKPTVGLTSRAGVVPISHNQDTVGPHCRTVADAATVLGALVGVDPRDPFTSASAGKFYADYRQFLNPNGLKGARIGVLRKFVTGYSNFTDDIFNAAVTAIQSAGATIIDPADPPSADQINSSSPEFTVLLYDFKNDVNAYLATRTGLPVKTLADLIAFNNNHAAEEMPYFKQEIFELAQATTDLTDPTYLAALALNHSLSREQGIDYVLNQYNLDALIAPTGSPAWETDLLDGDHFLGASSGYAAMAGYPIINVPAGNAFGMPVGISFIGTAWSEPTLIKLAYAYEQLTKARIAPSFRDNIPREKQGLSGSSSSSASANAFTSPVTADPPNAVTGGTTTANQFHPRCL